MWSAELKFPIQKFVFISYFPHENYSPTNIIVCYLFAVIFHEEHNYESSHRPNWIPLLKSTYCPRPHAYSPAVAPTYRVRDPSYTHTQRNKIKLYVFNSFLCLISTMPWRRMGNSRSSSPHSWLRHYMEMNGQLHSQAALLPRKEPQVLL
jgi:hypothetical protein